VQIALARRPTRLVERIRREGFQTAEQLVRSADLDERDRRTLLSQPRECAVNLRIGDERVTIRDQRPLLARRDLAAILQEGVSVEDWVHLLNTRVYLFTDTSRMRKLLAKYLVVDGAQEVLLLSPLRLLQRAAGRIELTAQNSGAIARSSGVQKTRDTFLSLGRFPDRQPAEVTVVDGLADVFPVVRAERHYADGTVELLIL
jgi:hypothetical protein